MRDYALSQTSGNGGPLFPGIGTLVNVVTVLIGTGIGVVVGHRLTQRTRDVVTDGLGLVTLLIAAVSAASIREPAWSDAVGDSAPLLIVLGALLVGGIAGSLLRIEDRLEAFGGWLQGRLRARSIIQGAERQRFIEGFVTSSLVFCVGPLTVLGSINDGLGNGGDQLFLKAALDGFASIAFAASLGWGVGASAIAILVVQGSLTLLGAALGDVIPDAHIAAMTTVGGLLLVGVALRLLRLKQLPVGDLLPALVLAPLLTAAVVAVRSM
ncbi:MAG TPA: DUF554 domain-containing protein [Nocardioidaceae bacterium]|nr:DUF554 domain-containing protein [Nocardioidaceae bacterium]